jgi:hypothetical protein
MVYKYYRKVTPSPSSIRKIVTRHERILTHHIIDSRVELLDPLSLPLRPFKPVFLDLIFPPLRLPLPADDEQEAMATVQREDEPELIAIVEDAYPFIGLICTKIWNKEAAAWTRKKFEEALVEVGKNPKKIRIREDYSRITRFGFIPLVNQKTSVDDHCCWVREGPQTPPSALTDYFY